ncbi:RHS repeat-associated protein [Chryseobacterium sp. AG844]|nr:RHS repeat-associated protein [Chryseobacterium sp. AG844]
MFDYGWRQYMPDLGRWNGIDQLAESYQMASPYAYVLNNPISFLDPDGRDVKPTSGGYEFSGSDLQNVMTYLQQNGSPRKLMSALSAWEEGNSGGGDFWGYFGSWNAFGAAGGDVGGSLYASTWGDGAMGATVYDIQEIVFTKTKLADVQSEWFKKQQLEAAWRQPGRAQMIGGLGDFLGIFDIGGQVISTWKPENRYLAMGAGILAAVSLRKPGLATAEMQAEKNLALGLGDDLFNFAEKNSFHTYRDFSTGFNKSKILDAMKSYDKIHFNTTGFGKIKFSKFDPKAPLTFRNYTNWEMHTIMNDASLLQKTIFYNKAADGTYKILDSYSPFY